jgi:hypothetical protein
MGMFEIISLMSSKDGDELFLKVAALLDRFGIDVFNEDGSVRNV